MSTTSADEKEGKGCRESEGLRVSTSSAGRYRNGGGGCRSDSEYTIR